MYTGIYNQQGFGPDNKEATENPVSTQEAAVADTPSVTATIPPPVESPAASTDTEHETPGVSEQQRAAATAGIDRQIKTVQDWMDAEDKPETKEDREKRERREKSKRIIAAVSDGISALGNLFFTSQYAPNMYNHEKGSALTAVGRRLDEQKAERERKHDRYMNLSLKLGALENQRAATVRELEAQQERQRIAREKAEREKEAHDHDKSMWDDEGRKKKGEADKAEYDAITSKAAADEAPERERAKTATEKARRGSYEASAASSRASAEASHARAGYYRTSGSKAHHFLGKEYLSDKDYTKDVMEAARQYNERHRNESNFVPIETEREEYSRGRKNKVPRRPEEYAGEVERRLAAEQDSIDWD